jgi:hypothetical protein
MKPRVPPIAQFAVGGSQFYRGLCRDQTNDHIRTVVLIEFCGKHHGGSHLGRIDARKSADYDVAGFQTPSRSCCSNRLRDAAVASLRSSSDQESDHSTGRSPPSSASCCAQSSTFLASPGGSIRTTFMSDSSLALRTMLLIFYAFRLTMARCFSPPDWESLRARVCAAFPVGRGCESRGCLFAVQVSNNGTLSNSVYAPAAEASSAIYSTDGSGEGQGLILNSDGTLNSPSNPAATGSAITMYALGEGPSIQLVMTPSSQNLRTSSQKGIYISIK